MNHPEPMYSEFSDPRLVALYDTFNALGKDSEFFVQQVKKSAPASIIDFGCGTGLLTCELAKQGYSVTGIDPSIAMLELARQKPYHEQVNWIQGSIEQLAGLQADVILMTSHVAQFFLEEINWLALLQAAQKSLNPGGQLIFDSRNPLSKPWEKWTQELSSQRKNTLNGQVEVWYEFSEIKQNRTLYEIHYLFENTGDELVSINELIYRSQEQITQSLTQTGFSVQNVYGDWDGSPASSASPEMIFVAQKG